VLRNPRSLAWCRPSVYLASVLVAGTLLGEGGGRLLSASHSAASPSLPPRGRSAAVAAGDGSLVVAEVFTGSSPGRVWRLLLSLAGCG
jgi:hypothetical protein